MPTEASKRPAAPARERHDSTVNVRMSTTTRNLIDTAASLLGKTRSEFITESARNHAVDILLDQRLFVLDEKDFTEFEAVLDRPPPPNDELRALLKKKPLWER
ncbi:DUF1778 domain-containing protein [Methylosinus sp. RM1]|uniref:type II toxin-antitoxin system TacA family antitoxin n=1 Tax=Methylosinus sp. RM1 TaxID=2583817 RepID=UPI0014097C8A|nr:DUF1778 domain-containing protein [Methylosinus sp. RM1]